MKKLISLTLAVLMVFALAACGAAPTAAPAEAPAEAPAAAPAEEPAAKVIFAYPQPDSGSTRWEIMANNVKLAAAQAGGEFIFMNVDYSPEAQIKFVENAIAAGAKGLLFWPCADSVLPQICKLCEENEVYWAISFRTISDPEIAEMVYASPYYVGKCFEDEVTCGYNVGEELAAAGKKKIAYIATARGDTTADLRIQGLEKACEEFGIEIVANYRDPQQASDITSATESFLASFDDLDGVVLVSSVVSDSLFPIAKAIEDAGRSEVQIVCVDFWDNQSELFENGTVLAAIGHPHIGYDPFICAIKIINAATGNPLGEGPVDTEEHMFVIRNYEDAAAYDAKYNLSEALFYSEEFIRDTLMKANNPDLTQESLQALMDVFDPLAY